jgi:hypothetical protein
LRSFLLRLTKGFKYRGAISFTRRPIAPSPCTGFQSDLDWQHLGKEGLNLPLPELKAEDDAVLLVHALQRENVLRRVNRNTFRFHWDGPFIGVN